MTRRGGFTLLEAMVALVILSLVVVASLELLGTTVRVSGNADTWSRAVTYAEDEMERLKDGDGERSLGRGSEQLPGGFERRVDIVPWHDAGLELVTVAVRLPQGGEVALQRLVEAR